MRPRPDRMKMTLRGRFVAKFFGNLPGRHRLLRMITAAEGGAMFSRTLRWVLKEHYGIVVGEYSYGSLLEPGMADRDTVIGRYVSIGPNVRRFGAAHPLSRESMHPLFYNPALGLVDADRDVVRTSCVVHAESWIGANVVILPGCRSVGFGAVVGAGAIVTKDVPDFAIAVGNPARVIGFRFTESQRTEMLSRKPWLLEPSDRRRIGGCWLSSSP